MQVRITLIGGEFRPSEEGMIGLWPWHLWINSMYPKHSSASMELLKQGFTAHFLESAELVRKMAQQADEVIVLSDSEKFSSPGFARIIPYKEADILITDFTLSRRRTGTPRSACSRY